MNLSQEYMALKACAKVGEEFVATLTQELAKDLLSRSKDCRPPNPSWVKGFAITFNARTYDLNKENSYPIAIDYDSDQLCDGVQRLHGFIKSGMASTDMKFRFAQNTNIIFTPYEAMNILRVEKEFENPQKMAAYRNQMMRHKKGTSMIMRLKRRFGH